MQDGKDVNSRQQVIDKIKGAANILVTVAASPSVDALSAALGLSLLLNKLDKHATAVFSGQIPPAITFLEPAKTFEHNVDSLRDFIIALDKEKADRLRYKVEDDVVRIFITPYKTTITDKDLKFSQGDFNIDLIVALGVEKRDDLDAAITAHGRILHDAAVVTVNASGQASNLGNINWLDGSSSSLCEMLMSVSDEIGGKQVDSQIATAFLTGIVAATDRFSNEHTSSRVMTLAAQLMAAGANQQLIASKLQEGHVVSPQVKLQRESSADTAGAKPEPDPATASDGEMIVDHEDLAKSQNDQEASPAVIPEPVAQTSSDNLPGQKSDEAAAAAESALDAVLAKPVAAAGDKLTVEDLHKDLQAASDEIDAAASEPVVKPATRTSDWRNRRLEAPALGGTLNATTSEAEAAKREEEESERNKRILSHNAPSAHRPAAQDEPMLKEEKTIEPVAPVMPQLPAVESVATLAPEAPAAEPALPTGPTLADLELQAKNGEAPHIDSVQSAVNAVADIDSARAAVDVALQSQPFEPSRQPLASVGSQPLPLAQTDEAQNQPEAVLPPAPALPPLPDFSTLPPLPPDISPQPTVAPIAPQPEPAREPDVIDPGQFKIPSQV